MTPWQKEMFKRWGNVRLRCHSLLARSPPLRLALPNPATLNANKRNVVIAAPTLGPATHRALRRVTPHARRRSFQGRAILVDGTHGTNKYKFCLTTVMVIDDHNRAIPVAFFLHSSQSELVLNTFFNRLAEELGSDFRPAVAIVDDAIAEINALQNSTW